jgi:hypothetical protein
MRKLIPTVLLAVMLLAPARARAELRFTVGAFGWIDRSGLFDLTLSGALNVARHFQVGLRGWAGLTASPTVAVIPLDLQLRVPVSRFYIEGNFGPWFVFEDSLVRAHGSVGFGVDIGHFTAGIELGYLQPDAILGAQLGVRFW